MSRCKKWNVLSILQPDLLPVEELVEIIESASVHVVLVGGMGSKKSTSRLIRALVQMPLFSVMYMDQVRFSGSEQITIQRTLNSKRCCRAENLRLMGKEGLVGLFRRVVLPLPQRLYRTNRRGKMLTARRARAGLGSDRKEEGSLSGPNGRLRPPPEIGDSHGLRVSCGRNGETNRRQLGGVKDRCGLSLGEAEAEDRRKGAKSSRFDSPSGRRITLKRPSSDAEKPSSEAPPPATNKRQRTLIKWP